MRKHLVLVVGLLAIALAACGGGGDGEASSGGGEATATNQVDIVEFNFKPQTITVDAGTTVTWTNSDTFPHSVKAEGDAFPVSPDMAQGQTYSFTFTQAGTYAYFCGIHNSMVGTVTVK
ncbi:MAG: cupredoxin family copper-binding protein [Actinomycetota bacterium]